MTTTSPLSHRATHRKPDSAADAIYDAELVRRFADKDESAFAEIMERHQARLFGLAHKLLRNAADAEEIVQDTFIRAHRGLATFRGDASLATWLHRIALNLSRNRYWYFFRRRRQDSLSLEMPLGEESDATFADFIAVEGQDPCRTTITREFSQLVADCMEKLDARHREILTRRNILNQSYEEIAQSLNLNVGTVKSRIARARESLRALLADCAPEFGVESEPSDFFEAARRAHGCHAIAHA